MMNENDFLNSLKYKIVEGKSNKILLIMTGIEGSLSGYNGKYDLIANEMKEKFDVSTFVISLPFGTYEHIQGIFDFVIQKIDEYFAKRRISDYEIYAMGSSAGGTVILNNFGKNAKIMAISAINPVFSVNFHKIIENLQNSKIRKTIILGEKDMSMYDYQILSTIEDLDIVVIPDGDHYLSGEDNFKFFLDIPKNYLIDIQNNYKKSTQ